MTRKPLTDDPQLEGCGCCTSTVAHFNCVAAAIFSHSVYIVKNIVEMTKFKNIKTYSRKEKSLQNITLTLSCRFFFPKTKV